MSKSQDIYSEDWARSQMDRADALLNLESNATIGNLHEALESCGNALRVWTQDAHPQDWAYVQMSRAIAFDLLAERGENPIRSLHEALESYGNALRVWTQDTHPEDWACAQMNRAIVLHSLADRGEDPIRHLQEALKGHKNALTVWCQETHRDDWAAAQTNCAHVFLSLAERGEEPIANLHNALEGYGSALRVWRQLTHPEEWETVQMCRTRALARLAERGENPTQNLQEALRAYQAPRHIDLSKMQIRDAVALCNLAEKGVDPVNNLHRALLGYGDAMQVWTKDTHPDVWAKIQMERGIALNRLAERGVDPILYLSEALEAYGAALGFLTENSDPADWARTQINCANACATLANLGVNPLAHLHMALDSYVAAMRVCKADKYPNEWALIQMNRGNALQSLGERGEDPFRCFHEAMESYDAALQVYDKHGHPDRWIHVQSSRGRALQNLAKHSEDRIQYLDEALVCYAEGLSVCKRESYPGDWALLQTKCAEVFWSLSRLKSAMHWFDAVRCLQSALGVYRPELFPLEFCHTNSALGVLHYEKNRYQEAFAYFEAALGVTEERRSLLLMARDRRRLLVENRQLYDLTVLCALQLQEEKIAIEYVEQSKTRNLADVVGRREITPKGVSETEWSDYRNQLVEFIGIEQAIERMWRDKVSNSVEAELPFLEQLNELRAALKRKEKEFRRRDPDYAPMAEPLTFDEMLSLAEQLEAVIVDFWVTPHGTAIFLISADDADMTADQVVWIQDWTLQRQTSILQEWLQNYRDWRKPEGQVDVNKTDWPRWMENTLGQLYTDLLRPVHERIGKRYGNPKRLILVPTKGLALLPLHACWWDDLEGNHYYFGKTFEVSYVPSLKILQRCVAREKEPASEKLVAIENPNPKRYLYFAPWEIEQVCNCFSNPVTIKHEVVTSERLKQELLEASHLHWSGHARTENPIEESHFELSDGRRFTMDDILTMDLHRLNLAVLGACETGMSELDEAIDEYEGLTAAFLSAGAATVVSSLWAVDDAATAYMMKRFYENVYKRAMNKAAALQEAQHWVRQLNPKRAEQLLAQSLTLERSQRRLVEHEHIAAERQLHKSFEEAEERTVGRAGLWDHPISWAAFHCVGIGWKTADSEDETKS